MAKKIYTCNNPNCKLFRTPEGLEMNATERFTCQKELSMKECEVQEKVSSKANKLPLLIGGGVLAFALLCGGGYAIWNSCEVPDTTVVDTTNTKLPDTTTAGGGNREDTQLEPIEPEPEIVPDDPVVIVPDDEPKQPAISPKRLINAEMQLEQRLHILQELEKGEITPSEQSELHKDLLVLQKYHTQISDQASVLATILDIEMELRRLVLPKERDIAVKLIQQLK